MNNALLLSIIGGGLVFLGLILLWIMMSVLVKITTQKNPPPASPEVKVEVDNLELTRKKKAAVAAVSAAITLLNSTFGASSHREDALISSWQAMHRNRQINQASQITRRKRS